MKKYTLCNLGCAACAAEMEKELNNDSAVRSATINFAAKTLLIDTDDITRAQAIISRIEPDALPPAPPEVERAWRDRLDRVAVLAGIHLQEVLA